MQNRSPAHPSLDAKSEPYPRTVSPPALVVPSAGQPLQAGTWHREQSYQRSD